jgi:hypothetical protein
VWKEVENVEDFTNRIIGLTAKLRLLDDNITDAEVVHKLCQTISPRWPSPSRLDIKNISVKEVTGMLHAVEQRHKPVVIHDNQG